MTKKQKRLILLNIPYVLMGLFATNLGEAWRISQTIDAVNEVGALAQAFPIALQNFLPSLHPFDLMVGIAFGIGMKVVVYVRGKNAKKYRHGAEYGTARWGTAQDIEPYMAPNFKDNIILMRELSPLFYGQKRRKQMTEKEIEKQLHRLYDPEGQYRINQKYSSSDKHVYTQEGDKYHWLTISRTGKNIYSVTKTDASGLITMRDAYQSDENSLRCISKERLVTKQGRSVLELLRESKRESERTSTIGRNKPKNKGDRSL